MTLAERMIWHLGRKYGYLLARHRNIHPLRLVEAACECFLNYYKNRSYDMRRNGELRVLRCLDLPMGAIAFDVGAHVGNYTAHIRTENPNTEIHAFEINPRNAAVFEERFKDDNSVHLHRFGLSDKCAYLTFYEQSHDGQISSHYRHSGAVKFRPIRAEVK